jgi:hypothetical protein
MLPKMVNHPPFSLEKYICYVLYENVRLIISAWLMASLQLLDNETTDVIAPNVRIVEKKYQQDAAL